MSRQRRRARSRIISEIAAVEGVDAIFIGPGDLAAAMGHAGESDASAVRAAIREGLSAIRKTGKAAGVLGYGAAAARSLCEDGADFVAIGADTWILVRGTTSLVSECREKISARSA